MARKDRKRRRSRGGSRGKLKGLGGRLALIAGLLLAIGYFVFTKTFFDPFESPQPAYQLLAPRNVDLFMRREALASDLVEIDGFPVPRVFDRVRRTAEWKDFSESSLWSELAWPGELEQIVDDVAPQLRDLPFDPVADVLGQEVVLLGRGLKDAGSWALLGRLTNKAKLAVELFGFESALESAMPGATRERVVDSDYPGVGYERLTLPEASLGAGGDTYYYARETDLLVVANEESLIRDVLHLVHGSSEHPVGLSRNFGDHMPKGPNNPTKRFSAGFTMTAGTLLDAWGLQPETETPKEDALANILLGLINTELLGDVVGRVELGPGELGLRMHGEIDVGRASNDTGGLLGQRAFPVRQRLEEVLGLMPVDVAAVVTMEVALGRFLTTVSSGFSPDVLKLVNTSLREVASLTVGWQVDTVPELIAELSRALGNRITMVVRPLDHEVPEGSQPLPAMAFLLPLDDPQAWSALEDAFLRAHDLFGVSADRMKQVSEGVGDRKWLGFVNQSIEELAYIVLDRETLAIATDNDLLREIVQAYVGTRKSLAGTPEVAGLLRQFEDSGVDTAQANAAAWVSSDNLMKVLEPYGAYIADMDSIIDFGAERVRQRRQMINRDYRQYQGQDSLPEDVEEELNEKLDALLQAQESKRQDELIPVEAQKWLEGFAWLPLVKQGALALRLGDRSTDLELHLESVGGR